MRPLPCAFQNAHGFESPEKWITRVTLIAAAAAEWNVLYTCDSGVHESYSSSAFSAPWSPTLYDPADPKLFTSSTSTC